MSNKEVIKTDKAPAAIGPYSQGIKAGDYVFFSGQIPLDPESMEIVSGGIVPETIRVMENMRAALDAAGLTFSDIVKTNISIKEMSDFKYVNEVYSQYFDDMPPARATVQVAGLPMGANIEIEWIAYCGE